MVEEAWTWYKLLIKVAGDEDAMNSPAPATSLKTEFERLAKQLCPYCSGYGHAGKDCPTDAKLSHLRGGVREQNALLQRLRNECRTNAQLANVSGFSLLRARRDPKRLAKDKKKFSWAAEAGLDIINASTESV